MKIVVLTCNKYRWLVPVFLYFYKKHWPDNPYKTEIVTESEHIDGTVFYSRDPSWATSVIKYIKQSEEDKFLLILEDYLIRQAVNTKRVRIAEKLCIKDVGYVRLRNSPKKGINRHTININIKGFREYPIERRFAMVVQTGIYQKKFLLDILREGESAWETESEGLHRIRKLKPKWRVLWPEEHIIDYPARGLLRKGILEPRVLRRALSELPQGSLEHKILQNQIKRQKEGRC